MKMPILLLKSTSGFKVLCELYLPNIQNFILNLRNIQSLNFIFSNDLKKLYIPLTQNFHGLYIEYFRKVLYFFQDCWSHCIVQERYF